MEAIISELIQSAGRETLLAARRAKQLQAEIDAFGPFDEVEAIEVDPDAIAFVGAVWQTLEFCRTERIAQLLPVPLAVVDSWDHRVETDHDLENMFTYSELLRELTLQDQWLRDHGA